MIAKKLGADLALVAAVFLATAGLVEAHKTYHGYIDPACIDFQLRSQTLSTRISNGVSTGKLDAQVADDLTAELQSLKNEAPANSQGRINARLHSHLDKLASRIDLQMRDRQAVSSAITDIVSKKARIRTQLSESAISPIQTARLEKKLDRISTYESYLLTNQGGLTYWQRKKINADLDLLASQLFTSRQKISLLNN